MMRHMIAQLVVVIITVLVYCNPTSAQSVQMGDALCDKCHTFYDDEFNEYYHYFLGVSGGYSYECLRGEGCHWQERVDSCIWVHYPCGWASLQMSDLTKMALLEGDVDAAGSIIRSAASAIETEAGLVATFGECSEAPSVVVASRLVAEQILAPVIGRTSLYD